MYDPKLGRWLAQDPLGFSATDLNLYRYVGNEPTNGIDPRGLEMDEFKYSSTKQPIFGAFQDPTANKPPVLPLPGYKTTVVIQYPDVSSKKRPETGYFLQLGMQYTIVITKDGVVHTVPVKYSADVQILDPTKYGNRNGQTGYLDTLSGPDFETKWGPNAVFVLSLVKKQQGFSTEAPSEELPKGKSLNTLGGYTVYWTQPDDGGRAKAFLQSMDKNFATGAFDYSYVYVNSDNYDACNMFKGKTVAQASKLIQDQIAKLNENGFPADTLATTFADLLSALDSKEKTQGLLISPWTHGLYSGDAGKLKFFNERLRVQQPKK
jgi:hypothetical protein